MASGLVGAVLYSFFGFFAGCVGRGERVRGGDLDLEARRASRGGMARQRNRPTNERRASIAGRRAKRSTPLPGPLGWPL